MIVVLIGHSGSGKSTVEKELVDRGLEKIVTYTTRPIRDNEVDGKDYHFMSEAEYEFLNSQGIFIDQNIYNNWNYGLSLEGIDYERKDYVVVLTPSGCQTIINQIDREHLKIIYLCVSEGTRKIRLLDRGDDLSEILRRINADRKDFSKLPFKVDYTFVDREVDDTVEGIMYRIIF